MQSAVGLTQVLHREQRLAVEGRHELQTGVDRLHGESLTLQLADNDGAGTAVALGAALFRAGLTEIFTQEIEYHLGRGDIAHGRDLAIQRKIDTVASRWRIVLTRWHWRLLLARRTPFRWYRLCCDGTIFFSLGVTREE
jgi:hypothetical protein